MVLPENGSFSAGGGWGGGRDGGDWAGSCGGCGGGGGGGGAPGGFAPELALFLRFTGVGTFS